MNTNPKAKRILVYGDSVAWGLVSGSKTFERFPTDVRWPGKLQSLLGESYEVIEENLCARTLGNDDSRPGFEGRNGLTYMTPCLDSADPVDLLIVSLGLNEMKSIFNDSTGDVINKTKRLLEMAKNRKPNFHEVEMKVLVLAPVMVNEKAALDFWGELWVGSEAKVKAYTEALAKLSDEMDLDYLDANSYVRVGVDGVHWDEHAHSKMASLLVDTIRKMNEK